MQVCMRESGQVRRDIRLDLRILNELSSSKREG